MSTRTERPKQATLEHVIAAGSEAHRNDRRRALLQRVGIGVGVLAAAAGVTGLALPRTDGNAPGPAGLLTTGAARVAGTAMPPWPAPTDTAARAQLAGLSLGPMGTAQHYHVHLDIMVSGHAVPVAPNIGVDPGSGMMTGLHTHDISGVIHIEAAQYDDRFTLGQLFTEWNVRLSRTRIGGLHAAHDETLTAYVNGVKLVGNPADLVLRPHDEIALVYGPAVPGPKIPSSYDFPPGA
jgi:hypothetical protein